MSSPITDEEIIEKDAIIYKLINKLFKGCEEKGIPEGYVEYILFEVLTEGIIKHQGIEILKSYFAKAILSFEQGEQK